MVWLRLRQTDELGYLRTFCSSFLPLQLIVDTQKHNFVEQFCRQRQTDKPPKPPLVTTVIAVTISLHVRVDFVNELVNSNLNKNMTMNTNMNDFVNDFDETGRSGEIGRSGGIGHFDEIVKKFNFLKQKVVKKFKSKIVKKCLKQRISQYALL